MTLPFAIFTAFFSLFGFKSLEKIKLIGERKILISNELSFGDDSSLKFDKTNGENFRTNLRKLGYTPSDLIISLVQLSFSKIYSQDIA